MVQPPATNLPDRAAPERDTLVATKFHVSGGGFLPRPRLVARLARGMPRGLTVVCTPAGFGKTTLLGEWARRSRRPVAWLSLDEADNDPARFWRYVAAALDQVRPRVGAKVEALLRGPEQPPLEAVATAVINELSRPGQGEIALVLDDYHLIQAQAVHDSVAFLLDRLPPGLRLLLTSRADPPLPLARLRARGQLAELPRTCASRWRRPLRSYARPPASTCRWHRWPPCRTAPRDGRPGYSSRPCRSRDTPTRPASWTSSPAATGMCWTT
jgi:hypothetical protein